MKLTPTVLPVIITILAIHRWIGIQLIRHRKFKVIRRIRTLSISTIRIRQCIIILLMIKMFIEIKMCNKLCFSTKPVKCRLDMCFQRTVRHLVCAILIWCDPSSSWRGNIHLGEKGCVSKVIWKVLQLKVILTRNLNFMKKINECSFCSFRSFDNELRSIVRITMK